MRKFYEKNSYPEIVNPKNIKAKIIAPKIKNHINHCDATFVKDPLSIPFHGINVYVANVTNIKKSNKLVSVIINNFTVRY